MPPRQGLSANSWYIRELARTIGMRDAYTKRISDLRRQLRSPRIKRARVSAAQERRNRPDLEQRQDESGHGNRKTYGYWFCRCVPCKDANADYSLNYDRNKELDDE